MTPKQTAAAKKASAAAKRAKLKVDELARIQKDEAAHKIATEAAAAAEEAALAAVELENEVFRQHQLAEKLEKEDPTTWEKIKKLFS